jgi:hypothetical protein
MNSNAQDSIAENFSCHDLVLRCHHFCSLVPDGCTRGRVAGSPRSGENRSSDTIRRSLRREIERIAKLDQPIERHHEAEGVAVSLVIDQFLDSHSWRQALPLTRRRTRPLQTPIRPRALPSSLLAFFLCYGFHQPEHLLQRRVINAMSLVHHLRHARHRRRIE